MDPFLARIESFNICFMNGSTENVVLLPLAWELLQELAIQCVVIDHYNILPRGGHVKVANTIQILPFPGSYSCFLVFTMQNFGQNFLEMFGWQK